MSDQNTTVSSDVSAQAAEQTGSVQVRLRINDAKMSASYANAFRTNTSTEEVVVDFGMNLTVPTGGNQQNQPVADIIFELNHRVVMNYYTAKRLAIMLGQVVRGHEERFGELKLNANERTK